MPNTLVDSRRSARSSTPYGIAEESTPTLAPVARTDGRRSAGPAAATAVGVTTSAATSMAMTRPDDPGKRRPVAALSTM